MAKRQKRAAPVAETTETAAPEGETTAAPEPTTTETTTAPTTEKKTLEAPSRARLLPALVAVDGTSRLRHPIVHQLLTSTLRCANVSPVVYNRPQHHDHDQRIS